MKFRLCPVIAAILVTLIFTASCCDPTGGTGDAMKVRQPADSPLRAGDRILFCGDSITDMAWSRPTGYYHLFTNALARLHPELGVRVADIGLSGRTVSSWTGELAGAVSGKAPVRFGTWSMADELTNHQDVVTLFLGMNDILRPTVRDDDAALDAWAADLRTLVRTIKAGTTPRLMILCTVTPLTAAETSPKNLVRERMNARLRRIAPDEGCRVAETGMTVELLLRTARRLKPGYQPVPDFVHPDAAGHLALADALARAIGDPALRQEFYARFTQALHGLEPAVPTLSEQVLTVTKNSSGNLEGVIAVNAAAPDAAALPDEVTLVTPPGWRIVSSDKLKDLRPARCGRFTVECTARELPLRSPFRLTADFGGKSVTRDFMIAAPWLSVAIGDRPAAWDTTAPFVWGKPVRWLPDAPSPAVEAALAAGRGFDRPVKLPAGDRDWKLFTPTIDYHGMNHPDALDPFGVTFGWQNDALYAARWVKSEKDRQVTVRLAHQTFSATLGLRVWVNGKKIGDAALNRFGGNRSDLTAQLKAGWNRLLVRCDHLEWQREFSCSLMPVAVDDLSALRYAWAPPEPAD